MKEETKKSENPFLGREIPMIKTLMKLFAYQNGIEITYVLNEEDENGTPKRVRISTKNDDVEEVLDDDEI